MDPLGAGWFAERKLVCWAVIGPLGAGYSAQGYHCNVLSTRLHQVVARRMHALILISVENCHMLLKKLHKSHIFIHFTPSHIIIFVMLLAL